MSVLGMGLVWQLDMVTHEKMVLLALADHASDDGVCWPGMKGVAQKCSLSVRRLQEIVANLERKGWVSREPRHTEQGRQVSNIYVLWFAQEAKDAGGRVRPTAGGGCGPPQGEGAAHRTPLLNEPSKEPSIKNHKDDSQTDRLSQWNEWKKEYPALDIEAEMRGMLKWYEEKGERPRNVTAAFNAWLKKARQNVDYSAFLPQKPTSADKLIAYLEKKGKGPYSVGDE
jgi:hypothetical protein